MEIVLRSERKSRNTCLRKSTKFRINGVCCIWAITCIFSWFSVIETLLWVCAVQIIGLPLHISLSVGTIASLWRGWHRNQLSFQLHYRRLALACPVERTTVSPRNRSPWIVHKPYFRHARWCVWTPNTTATVLLQDGDSSMGRATQECSGALALTRNLPRRTGVSL